VWCLSGIELSSAKAEICGVKKYNLVSINQLSLQKHEVISINQLYYKAPEKSSATVELVGYSLLLVLCYGL
jgi:hypothetical protein